MALQGPDGSADTGAKSASQEKGEDSGVNFKELALDKMIDFVLIFVGLYAAIAVQKWQDSAKERDDYVALLGDFKSELTWNQKQREALEKDLGPISEKQSGKALGPMQKAFDDFNKEAHEAEQVLSCVGEIVAVAKKGAPSAAQRKRIEECAPILEQAEKEGADPSKGEKDADEKFRPIDLTPFYRAEVWQLYLANGIRFFQNKDLAVQIGGAYSRAKDIEKSVAEIEALYNDAFIQKTGEVAALSADLEESIPEDADFKSQGDAIGLKLTQVSRDVRGYKFAVIKIENMMELKVIALKVLLADMDKLLITVTEEIEKELAKQKK